MLNIKNFDGVAFVHYMFVIHKQANLTFWSPLVSMGYTGSSTEIATIKWYALFSSTE